jgi:hypothetical protein
MNWTLPYETPEYINKVVTDHERRAAYTQRLIDNRLNAGKSMYYFISGYVVNRGGTHGFDTKAPIYGFYPTRDQNTSRVLVEVVGGGTMWLLYNNQDIHIGTEAIAKGRNLRMLLETLSN